jgi:hypothetical protein
MDGTAAPLLRLAEATWAEHAPGGGRCPLCRVASPCNARRLAEWVRETELAGMNVPVIRTSAYRSTWDGL